ncbi:hypothetical protein C1T31_07025 [Hanstruepera neustonica]|uniref:Outer membrane protein beta-barrel domain-containing protein n=1 Tax=Hanstruepera neustonica TaxID=1445657 RepID=A0A2K1DZ08_9FLAO|nr:outer membrane beta-barrel protein [Hanstruepera neustonica]PNQ73267.1 hypothetical protein C1T31_07025 [Hanstruepera neustonica]
MRYLVLSLLTCLLFSNQLCSQNAYGFGFKGGVNYNANGDYFESINANAKSPDRNIGFHFGVFGKVGKKLYFKPELVYTSTKSDYDNESFKMQKLDAPLLTGITFFRHLNIFAGPSLQYILDTEFGRYSIDNVKNEFTVGLNFGVGFSLKKLGVDLRYERGFSENEATFINNNGLGIGRIDTRPDQLILSLSLIL